MKIPPTRIGLLSFSDGRKRVHEGLKPGILDVERRIRTVLEEMGATVIGGEDIVYTPRAAVREAKRMLSADTAAVLFNIPVFAFPNLSALAAGILQKPIALLSPGEPGLPGLGGLMAAGGALEQIGIFQERIWGPPEGTDVRRRLEIFLRGAGARHALRGQVYGQIGGRSIGMITGVSSSTVEWHRIFGVDTDHVDQSEILRIAGTVPEAERDRIVDWLEAHLGKIHYASESKLTRESLKQQAACAAAVKTIIRERELDFVGIKCHYDLSEYYSTQCLSAAFLPSFLDWDGKRAPVACACEADGDGALTMQILQLLTGRPALFMDLRHFDTERSLWTFCNCGGQSVYYARRSDDPSENLKGAELTPVIPKYGGTGAHVRYVGEAGELTCVRLMHDAEGILLTGFRGRVEAGKMEWLEKTCPAWPHLFVRVEADPHRIIETLQANHIHAVEGDRLAELEKFARMAGIRWLAV